MADDWDLYAVVRGCSAVSSSATTTTTVFSGGVSSQTNPIFTIGRQRNAVSFGEIRDLCTPFKQESNVSVVSSFSCLNYPEEPRKAQNQKRPLSLSASSGSVTSKPTGSNTSRSKRRKIQHKKVCHVAAEALNSDVWAWRKYGQKPIKGSPYPRMRSSHDLEMNNLEQVFKDESRRRFEKKSMTSLPELVDEEEAEPRSRFFKESTKIMPDSQILPVNQEDNSNELENNDEDDAVKKQLLSHIMKQAMRDDLIKQTNVEVLMERAMEDVVRDLTFKMQISEWEEKRKQKKEKSKKKKKDEQKKKEEKKKKKKKK